MMGSALLGKCPPQYPRTYTDRIYRSLNNYPKDINVMVDLDAEQNRPPGKTRNEFRLVVRPTKTVNMAVLHSWLTGETSYTDAINESMCK